MRCPTAPWKPVKAARAAVSADGSANLLCGAPPGWAAAHHHPLAGGRDAEHGPPDGIQPWQGSPFPIYGKFPLRQAGRPNKRVSARKIQSAEIFDRSQKLPKKSYFWRFAWPWPHMFCLFLFCFHVFVFSTTGVLGRISSASPSRPTAAATSTSSPPPGPPNPPRPAQPPGAAQCAARCVKAISAPLALCLAPALRPTAPHATPNRFFCWGNLRWGTTSTFSLTLENLHAQSSSPMWSSSMPSLDFFSSKLVTAERMQHMFSV